MYKGMFNRLFLLLCVMTAVLNVQAAATDSDCPVVRIVPEHLPDMTMPRSGHCIFYADGELTVAGGHTTNFVITRTAERLAAGEWHLMNMAYPHDNGFALVLRSGEVLIGGGHNEELGIGQTFTLERYHPATHSFEGFGCLDRRRVLANASELADGRVIVSGNHYAADGIGCYDGRSQVQRIKDVSLARSNPYILPIAADDAIIVSGNDLYDRHPDTLWVDRVKGETFRVPLLEQWRPVYTDQPFNSKACSIGRHSYLLTATNADGQLGIIKVSDKAIGSASEDCEACFSLLPTVCPIPMSCQSVPVFYKGPIVVDTLHQRGYVIGVDSLYQRQYILAVDYAEQPAGLTLYYADSIGHATVTIPMVTPEGDLLLVGGIAGDNYKPLSTVWLYRFATVPQSADTVASGATILWLVLALGVLTVFACVLYLYRKRKCMAPEQPSDQTPAQPTIQLMERIAQLLERDQRYLTRMKVSDVALELGVSVSEVTECISQQHGCTFAQLMAAYRVRYAQQLLFEQPDMKLATLIAQSGFTSETTFFRSFKEVVGTSPKEWIESHKASHESTAET